MLLNIPHKTAPTTNSNLAQMSKAPRLRLRVWTTGFGVRQRWSSIMALFFTSSLTLSNYLSALGQVFNSVKQYLFQSVRVIMT